MKILILGAGQVGTSVAANLVNEANDITVVDTDAGRLRELADRFDLRTLQGHGAHPDVLTRAGAEDTDMIIAVTNSDETNMVACQVAYTLFHTPTKIARVRAQSFLEQEKLFGTEALPIDVRISPEQLVTDYILRLIENPGTLQVTDFAAGRVRLVAVRAYYGGPLVGHELRTLYDHMPHVDTRVAAIYRHDRAIQPGGNTVIEADDEVFFVAAPKHIRSVMSELRRLEKPYKRLIFAGGGNIGTRLARATERDFRVKVIESDLPRCKHIAEQLERTIVLHGDAADEELLLEENIEDTDVFCAVTDDDEANILSAMLAKRLGARKVMALINRTAYVDLVQSGPIDIAISPQQATIGSLLKHVRRGDVVMVHSLRHGAAEAIEAIAHGDESSSKVVGRPIEAINLPKGASIGAIVRGEEVLIAHHDTVIESEDHVILFLQDKLRVPEVEKLFQVGVTFF
ncbi:Trk system potassium transporter TrkA [Thiohalocapsa marina]|uniref:Trk system potassium uptake protein TrkA n=1 Tax=Thiohalocapsa marina TaxID=424902 RepID=A0A5M8FJG1_9GAMM|nr:Trk system potassium transporter TrkA [Thiohalocapsa marina]KAA6183856.1 Trk system potassium transporter TrkA [Thiohalocapsa marina]